MKLLTKSITEQLLRNGRIRQALAKGGRAEADFLPVVKLFTPDARCTWLLSELDPYDPDIASGLATLNLTELRSRKVAQIYLLRPTNPMPRRQPHQPPLLNGGLIGACQITSTIGTGYVSPT